MLSQIYLTLALLVGTKHCHVPKPYVPTPPKAYVPIEIIQRDNFQQYGLALEAIFGMGIRLNVLLDSADGNFVVSPLSTTAVIAQLMLGAEGELLEHLYDLLSLPKKTPLNNIIHYGKDKINQSLSLPYSEFHLQLSSLLKTLSTRKTGEQFILNVNNGLFYNEKLQLKNKFRKFLSDLYNTDIEPLNFCNDTTKIINGWASKNTNGLIKAVLPSPPPPSTSSIFMNSLYFLAEWEIPFSSQLNTIDAFFVNENETVNATYMLGLMEQIPFIQTEKYRVVNLPYKNRELGLYLIYPNQVVDQKYDIKDFTFNLDMGELLKNIARMKLRDVILKIPKLSLSNSLSILEPLRKYAEYKKANVKPQTNTNNVIDALHDKIEAYANFTPKALPELVLTDAANGTVLRVSDIVQQMVFSINEKGTEAAAVTAAITDYMGGVKTVVLNRPFTFFIRHEATLATLFWGTVTDPSRN